MEITERPPARFDLPGRGEPVCIATQRRALEPWEGEDPPGLAMIWSRKPKFAVNGNRSCAELAIVHHLRNEGWHGAELADLGRAVGGSRLPRSRDPVVLPVVSLLPAGREAYVVSSGRGRFSCGGRAAAGGARTAGRKTEATRPTRPTTAKAIIASP